MILARCGRIGAVPLLLGLAACAPAASQPGPTLTETAATTLAWVGEDPELGLKVVVEPLHENAEAGAASVSVLAPLLGALALRPEDGILQVHVFGSAAGSELAALAWPDGSRMLPAQPREEASARERLLYEAVGAGGAHAWTPSMPSLRHDYLVVGPLREPLEADLAWSEAPASLRLTPRRWTAAERQEALGIARPAHAEAAHD